MIPSFCSQLIVRDRAGIKDSRGSQIQDWDNVESITIYPCSVQPASSSISIDGRVLGISDSYVVYCMFGEDVRAGDRIYFEGKYFIINEEPRLWLSPTGRVSNTQFTMIRWEG